jgi:hypothetical protein
MSISSVKTGVIGDSLLAGNAFFDPGYYQSIATSTVGSGGTGTITFSSIPATYKHLQLRCLSRTNRATYSSDSIAIRFNSDTGANYSYHLLYGQGSSVSVAAVTSTTLMEAPAATTTATANPFAGAIIDVIDYESTNKNKTIRVLGAFDNNSGSANQEGYVTFASGLWMNTTAVNTITLTPKNGSLFSEYSSFALYGIKG